MQYYLRRFTIHYITYTTYNTVSTTLRFRQTELLETLKVSRTNYRQAVFQVMKSNLRSSLCNLDYIFSALPKYEVRALRRDSHPAKPSNPGSSRI